MPKNTNLKKFAAIGFLAISMQSLGISYSSANDTSVAENTALPTGSLTPDSFTETTIVGRTISLNRTVTIDTIPDVITTETITQDKKIDVLFLADNTSSMTSAIDNVKNNATDIITHLSNYGDLKFGVAKYHSDPGDSTRCDGSWFYSDISLECDNQSEDTFGADGAYDLLQPIGASAADVLNAIGASTTDVIDENIQKWQADSSPNGDWAEGNFFALHQAATNGATVNGYGTGDNTNWRSDAEKVIVWFGDAYSNTGTINQADTIAALKAQGIKVIAINADSKTYANVNSEYLSSVVGLDYNSQASTIAAETGGAYANADPSELSETIKRLVGDAVIETTETTTSAGTVDLAFQAQSDTDLSGINITYTCTDDRGCSGVTSGESRTFRMDVEGVTTGIYDFKTQVVGVSGAVGTDRVTVVNFAD